MDTLVAGKTYFGVNDVAKMFQVNPETVKRWLREDKLEGETDGKHGKKHGYSISYDAIEKFVAVNTKYKIHKQKYDRTDTVKRKERADVFMELMVELTRMRVNFTYCNDGNPSMTKDYIKGWNSCMDQMEAKIKEILTEV